jgi:hypothetical protein
MAVATGHGGPTAATGIDGFETASEVVATRALATSAEANNNQPLSCQDIADLPRVQAAGENLGRPKQDPIDPSRTADPAGYRD